MQQTRAASWYNNERAESRAPGTGDGQRARAASFSSLDGYGQGSSQGSANPAAAEALLRAQLLEARREMSRCQQELEDNRASLRQQQQLLRSAAGEARREVLGLREDKASLTARLAQAQQQIQALEAEVRELKERAMAAASASEASLQEWVDSGVLREQLDAKEQQLSVSEAKLEAHKDSQRSLSTQVAELMGQVSMLVVDLEKRRQEVQSAAAEIVALKEELQATIESREQVASRAEMLENELGVMREEGADDRVSGAAQLLALEQRCQELEARLRGAQGEPATPSSDAAAVQRGGFAAHSISDQATRSSTDDSAKSSPFSNDCSPGLKSLLEPTGAMQGVVSPERACSRHMLGLEGALEAAVIGSGGDDNQYEAALPGAARSETGLELAADLAAAATYLNQLHRRLQSSPREGLSVSGKQAGGELDGAVKCFQAALAGLESALSSRAELQTRGVFGRHTQCTLLLDLACEVPKAVQGHRLHRVRCNVGFAAAAEEQATVNLTADSRDAGDVSVDVDCGGRRKGFWPLGLLRTALLVPAAAAALAAAALLPSQD